MRFSIRLRWILWTLASQNIRSFISKARIPISIHAHLLYHFALAAFEPSTPLAHNGEPRLKWKSSTLFEKGFKKTYKLGDQRDKKGNKRETNLTAHRLGRIREELSNNAPEYSTVQNIDFLHMLQLVKNDILMNTMADDSFASLYVLGSAILMIQKYQINVDGRAS